MMCSKNFPRITFPTDPTDYISYLASGLAFLEDAISQTTRGAWQERKAMSLRRATPARAAGRTGRTGPVGLVAAPVEASLFERTLVKEAMIAHLGNMTRRLKREPIGQKNPWLAEFKRQSLQHDEDLRNEINGYQDQIEKMREKLTKSKDDGDVQRLAQIVALEKQLEEEQLKVERLKKELSGMSSESSTYQTQLSTAQANLSEAQASLQTAEDKVADLEEAVSTLTVRAAVASADLQTLQEKFENASRAEAVSTADREALRAEVETAAAKLTEMKASIEEYKEEAQNAKKEFNEQLDRNKELLEEVQTKRKTLAKEAENLQLLEDKLFTFEKKKKVYSGDL